MLALESCITTIISFDLWMSKSGHDTFALVINFINSHWVPCHVIVGLFEANDTFGVVMATQVKELLSCYNLLDILIAYMKDKGGNLSTLARALSSMVSYVPLKLALLGKVLVLAMLLAKHANMLAIIQQYVLAFGRSA